MDDIKHSFAVQCIILRMKIIQCNICKNKNKSPLTFSNLILIHNQHPKSFYTILTLIATALYHNVVYKKRKFFEIRIQPLSYATQLTSFVSCVNGSKLGSFFNNYLVLFLPLFIYTSLLFFCNQTVSDTPYTTKENL